MAEPASLRAGLLEPAFLLRLEKLELVARNVLSGEMRGDTTTRRRGQGALFREHKPYTQGDDLRFVDWNVFSRLGELVVKQFDAEEALKLSLILDATASMDFGKDNKLVCAQRLAAALGYVALNRLASVELEVIGGRQPLRSRWFGRPKIRPFLSALEGISAGGGADLFERARAFAGRRGGRGVAIVISDFFAETGYARALQLLKHAGFKLGVVHVLDVADARPALAGSCRLVDMESERSARAVLGHRELELYAAEVGAWCAGVERFCHVHEISYCRVDTHRPLEDVVMRLLVQKGMLR
jgi:uncharacterized protein (DUF58 family)